MTESKIRIIGVTGMPGSGKSVFADHANNRGYQTVVMGDVVRAKVLEYGYDPTPDTSRKVMMELREKHGEEAVAHLTCQVIDKLTEEGNNKIIIDGIRSQAEVKHFRKHLEDNFIIVAIHVDPLIRYDRLKLRGRSDAPKTEKDFAKRDEAEISLGLGETIAFSNYILCNNRTIDSFEELSLSLLEDLEKVV
ncbi:MAG: AAA family ATPase [Candidatus Heimdallarchaeota archaeon]|nr:AAA family ATPase [Candidatus Heimdallarchaeota archaeon]